MASLPSYLKRLMRTLGKILRGKFNQNLRQVLVEEEALFQWSLNGAGAQTPDYDSGDAGYDRTLRIVMDDPNVKALTTFASPFAGDYAIELDTKVIVGDHWYWADGVRAPATLPQLPDVGVWKQARVVFSDVPSGSIQLFVSNSISGDVDDEILIGKASLYRLIPRSQKYYSSDFRGLSDDGWTGLLGSGGAAAGRTLGERDLYTVTDTGSGLSAKRDSTVVEATADVMFKFMLPSSNAGSITAVQLKGKTSGTVYAERSSSLFVDTWMRVSAADVTIDDTDLEMVAIGSTSGDILHFKDIALI